MNPPLPPRLKALQEYLHNLAGSMAPQERMAGDLLYTVLYGEIVNISDGDGDTVLAYIATKALNYLSVEALHPSDEE
jgi:hypothetical protein